MIPSIFIPQAYTRAARGRRFDDILDTHLRPTLNTEYQNIAKKIAGRYGLYCIHLDLIYWRGGHIIGSRQRKFIKILVNAGQLSHDKRLHREYGLPMMPIKNIRYYLK